MNMFMGLPFGKMSECSLANFLLANVKSLLRISWGAAARDRLLPHFPAEHVHAAKDFAV